MTDPEDETTVPPATRPPEATFTQILRWVRQDRGITAQDISDAIGLNLDGLPIWSKRYVDTVIAESHEMRQMPPEIVFSRLMDAYGVHASDWRDAAVRQLGGRLRSSADTPILKLRISDRSANRLTPEEIDVVVKVVDLFAAGRGR